MTQEEQLVFIDLSSRVAFGPVFVNYSDDDNEYYDDRRELNIHNFGSYINEFKYIKPYLRPLSNMTEDEKNELKSIITEETSEFGKFIKDGHGLSIDGLYMFWKVKELDWLNSHYFDYRGLIEKGLALEAPKTYNIKTQGYE